MATEAEILSKLNTLLSAYREMLSAGNASKMLTLDRASGADAALTRLHQGGAEMWRIGMAPGENDFVIQKSPDGTELNYADVLRIDAATGEVTLAGLALDSATFADARFEGQTLFAGGSAEVPAMAPAGDDNTGLFFPGADQIAAVTGGVTRVLIDNAGRVGIGTEAVAADLHIKSAYPSIRLQDDADYSQIDANSGVLRLSADAGNATVASAILMLIDGSEKARITTAGRFAIGTTNPLYDLDVTGSARASSSLLVGTSVGTAYGNDNLIKPASPSAFLNIKGGSGIAKVVVGNSSTTLVAGGGADAITMRIGATSSTDGGLELAKFDASGFSLRDTQGDDDVRMTLYPNGSTYSQLGASSTISFIDSGGARPFVVYTNGSERSRMTENGALLIGTSVSGASKLVVNDDSLQINTPKTPASASDTGTAGQIAWDDDHIYVCTATDTWKRAALSTW
ncbi:hypothetical protein [Stappia sp. ICDLI1TA098]